MIDCFVELRSGVFTGAVKVSTMGEFIGVNPIANIYSNLELKRQILMFDKIGVPLFSLMLDVSSKSKHFPKHYIRDLEWAFNEGMIFEILDEWDVNELLLNQNDEYRFYALLEDYWVSELNRLDWEGEKGENSARKIVSVSTQKSRRRKRTAKEIKSGAFSALADVYRSLRICIQIRENSGSDAHPFLTFQVPHLLAPHAKERDVAQIILNALPVPDESTSWEQIVEYRSDPDSHSKFLDLRNWMNEVARAKLSPIEIEQKLEYLISQYQRHMELHKMKTNAGILETVTVSSAEFLEDLVKFKWGKIAKGLFSLKHRRIALMEGELTLPGSEVAYVIKAREHFS